MLFTLCSGTFPLVPRCTNHAACEVVVLESFGSTLSGDVEPPSSGTQEVPNLEPSETLPHTRTYAITHIRKDKVTLSPSAHARSGIISP
jgi:hypothetical protein